MPTKYSDADLKQLYEVALREGSDLLERGERIALTRYCNRENLRIPGLIPKTAVTVSPAEVMPKAVDKASTDSVVDAQTEEVQKITDSAALNLVTSMKWYGTEFPATIITSKTFTKKYLAESRALREFAGQVGRVVGGVDRKQATRIKRRIRKGDLKAFLPVGSWQAEIIHEGDAYSVLARYSGAAK